MIWQELLDVHVQGVKDGFAQGQDFAHGRTYDDPALNEVYDQGVNLGIVLSQRPRKDRS